MVLHNYMEDMVEQSIDLVMKQIGCCACEKCRADVLAITLNSLPARYVVTETGGVYAKLAEFNQTSKTNVVTQIAIAAEKVKARPQH